MWVYKMSFQTKKWEVGFFYWREPAYNACIQEPEKQLPQRQVFQAIEVYDSEYKARQAVNFLNGGNSEVGVSGTVYNKT